MSEARFESFVEKIPMNEAGTRLQALLRERIVYLDGAMGTLIQRERLTETDFRSREFADWPRDLKGDNELLSLTQPQIIKSIYRRYYEAGSDIISANTFSANSISQREYGLEKFVPEMVRASIKLAQEVRSEFAAEHPERAGTLFICASIGPTNKMLSMSSTDDPAHRDMRFDELVEAYREALAAALEAGVDAILFETITDPLNTKAGIFALDELFRSRGERVPVIISGTISAAAERLLTGQTPEAFWNAIRHAKPLAIGFNCGTGAGAMRHYIETLSKIADCAVSCHPNAGMPNPLAPSGYSDGPEAVAAELREFAKAGLVNILGGCCGTTPEHIAAIRRSTICYKPREIPSVPATLRLSGLEAFNFAPIERSRGSDFVMVGERSNVLGSPKFRKLVEAGDWTGALEIARQQVENGAAIIDVNFDDGMIDGEACMERFLNLLSSEPAIARVPVMIDSSKFSIIETGLRCVAGKPIVNSISLKEGEEIFLQHALTCAKFGAAMIVMAFDEIGQAASYERKVEICERAYKLLTKNGVPAEDIIFDVNVLTIGTGMASDANYGLDFIRAVETLKKTCPGARTSGGISNISFAFRGNNPVREAIHAVFLYHAIRAGLDMGIVNAGMLAVYDELPAELRERVEDVVLNRVGDATDNLLAIAAKYNVKKAGAGVPAADPEWRKSSYEKRIEHALVHGILPFIKDDILEAYNALGSPLAVIEGPLMAGMSVVGTLFGEGKMFLPQVMKAAGVMKAAVEVLNPLLEAEESTGTHSRKRIVLATVKGDNHDIGKNIVATVLTCNGYEIIDLGVNVPADKILQTARERQADAIALSGLITPSLDEMASVASEMERNGFTIPLFVGGAATSKMHTALKIAPNYPTGGVFHTLDAAQLSNVFGEFFSRERHDAFVAGTMNEYEKLRMKVEKKPDLLTLEEARGNRFVIDFAQEKPFPPNFTGTQIVDIPLDELKPLLARNIICYGTGLKGAAAAGTQGDSVMKSADELFAEIRSRGIDFAHGVFGIWPAFSENETIFVENIKNLKNIKTLKTLSDPADLIEIVTPRQRKKKPAGQPNFSLADFIAPAGTPDWIGGFCVTAGQKILDFADSFQTSGDDYHYLVGRALANAIAEAAAEWLHEKVRKNYWGYAARERLSAADLLAEKYSGIRPAIGYPILPDHTQKRALWKLLSPDTAIGVTLTDTCMMLPLPSTCGLYFASPQSRYFDARD